MVTRVLAAPGRARAAKALSSVCSSHSLDAVRSLCFGRIREDKRSGSSWSGWVPQSPTPESSVPLVISRTEMALEGWQLGIFHPGQQALPSSGVPRASPTFSIAEAASHSHAVRAPIAMAPEVAKTGSQPMGGLIHHMLTFPQPCSDLPPVSLQCALDFLQDPCSGRDPVRPSGVRPDTFSFTNGLLVRLVPWPTEDTPGCLKPSKLCPVPQDMFPLPHVSLTNPHIYSLWSLSRACSITGPDFFSGR